MSYDYLYMWGNNPVRKQYQHHRCRVLARGALNSVMVEFEDGHRMITSWNAIRPLPANGLLRQL